ncbi:uncharacterized protein LOC124283841 [Haliotis rubra]|uniref:uncharacterized protein LOC124283841 n=1 Tax=Haliotis rubra TaxID=36100 RepID=UPI001EE614CE|nr:uncharacterized protein LOC124283841 [Haliotis rubra]
MEDGQRPTDDSDTQSGGCTPADRRTDRDGDTSLDVEHMEAVGIARGSPQGASEGPGMEGAENRDVDEESCGSSDDRDEEEGDGIQDMLQLGARAEAVKFQTVHQQSYQLAGKDTKSLVQHIVGCCQPAQGEITSAPQQQQQLQPGSGGDDDGDGDGDGRTDQAHLSTSTTCVVPKTSPQVPGTSALTPPSTSSLLSQIPGSLASQIQSGLPEVPMTGDSIRVTLSSQPYVQVTWFLLQDFGTCDSGHVTVKGGKNLNIGGTQNVGTAPTNKEEEEKPLTAAQKIRKRTASRIQSWTKDIVETAALKKVKEKLDRGATWVTIKGRPGEGKSTTAYMVLKNLDSQGRQVYQVESPEEYSEVIMAYKNPVIMLDDIFGDLEFDAAEWAKWRPRLRPMVDVKHPDTYAEKDVLGISTKSEKVSEMTKVDQTEVKQETIIILVGRDYVLKSSLADLGRMADYISSPQYVVEVSSQRASYERRKIWRVHAEAKNIDIEESTVSRICEADCPHGFPHVCKMFVAAYEKDWTQLQMQMFFQAPLDFLSQTLNRHLTDKIKRSLFMAMIKRDGKISGQEMEEDDNFGYEYIAAADNMVGSYLKKEDDTYVFDHPSIYDSVSFILSTKQPKFVIENCSLSFINQRLRLTPSTAREGPTFCADVLLKILDSILFVYTFRKDAKLKI